MSESKLRNMSMDFSVDIINLVKHLKSQHESIIANQIGRSKATKKKAAGCVQMNVVMIMCHKNAQQVIRFAQRCHTQHTDVVIHCDSTLGADEYAAVETFAANTGIYLTDRRLHGELDTRSLVDIAMEMVNKAKRVEAAEDKKYQYFLLCSGQDYLIKPMAYIEQQLCEQYPQPFIDCTPYHPSNWVYHKFIYNGTVMRLRRWIANHCKSRVTRKAFRTGQMLLTKLVQMTHCTSFEKCQKAGIALYGGSAWWILPDGIISYICQEYNKPNNAVTDLLLNETLTPEEGFFQIMTMRSPLKHLTQVNPIEMREQNCKTWAYFSGEDKPFTGHPYIITSADIKQLEDNDCWFARKFDITVDGAVFDRIDQSLLHQV